MKSFYSSNGYEVFVDDQDYEDVIRWRWFVRVAKGYFSVQRTGYSSERRKIKPSQNGSKTIKLSRYLLGVTDRRQVVDHIDRNPLNNCRSNLRVCEQYENARNKTSQRGATSKYLGVHRIFPDYKDGRPRYRVRVSSAKYTRHNIGGIFDCEAKAALAYNDAAKKYYGEFANLNQIEAQ